jgi:hypothetical protein
VNKETAGNEIRKARGGEESRFYLVLKAIVTALASVLTGWEAVRQILVLTLFS